MGTFAIKVDGIVTGSSANTYAGLLGLKLANTAGHRARLRRLVVGGAGAAAQDINVDIRIRRTSNAGDGTSTSVNVNTIGSLNPNQIASVMSAVGKTYTVAPSTYENGALGGGSVNSRGTLVLEWPPNEGPLWGINQTLVIEGAPSTAAAVNLGIAAEWDEGV